MLAVGVDARAERISVLDCVSVAGGNSRGQAAVGAERDHLGAMLTSDLGRAIGRAVVDDEDVRLRKLASYLLEHRGKVVLLVPGRKEDERVGSVVHGSSLMSRMGSVLRSRGDIHPERR